MGRKKKEEIITFKVDDALREALECIPNRSEFIREAIQTALKNTCPLCQGSGVLSLDQITHWKSFAVNHKIQRCDDCKAVHLTCTQKQS